MKKRDWQLLFYELDLADVLRNQLESVSDRVRSIPKQRFDAESDDFLAATVASELVAAPITLLENNISVAARDARIDVSHDFGRAHWGDGPTYANGLEVTYHLPYKGDPTLFRCRPSTWTLNPPRAVVRNGELRFPYDQPDRNAAATKAEFVKDVEAIKQWLARVNAQVDTFNQQLTTAVGGAISARRTELDRTASELASLGYTVRTDAGAQAGHGAAPLPQAPAARKARRERAQRKFDVALSFAGEDRDYVEQVASALESMGVAVFYDRYEQVNLWGADLAEHLGRVYGSDSRFVVMFASRHYATKAWPNHEKQFALGRHLRGDQGRILPVRFDDTEIPGLPPTIGYLDVRVLTPPKLAELIRQKVDSMAGDA